jgi:3'(2'), 5'-bisphosphate nucleotidase
MDELTTIVSRAAAAILAIDPATAARRTKSDLSPVSVADEASNREIIKGLSSLIPGMPIVSEESIGPSSAPLGPSFALVDPLDGTREFLAGRNEFTANIALVIDDTPAVGIIAAPALGLIWRGIVGRGAERLRLCPGAAADDADQIVAIRTRRRLAQGLIALVSRSHFDPVTAAMLARLPVKAQVACGSSIKFCQIAEGSADIYARLAPTHEWDIAAGHAIVTAAGGTVTTPEGKRLTYGRATEGFLVPAFLALGDPEIVNSTFHVGQ